MIIKYLPWRVSSQKFILCKLFRSREFWSRRNARLASYCLNFTSIWWFSCSWLMFLSMFYWGYWEWTILSWAEWIFIDREQISRFLTTHNWVKWVFLAKRRSTDIFFFLFKLRRARLNRITLGLMKYFKPSFTNETGRRLLSIITIIYLGAIWLWIAKCLWWFKSFSLIRRSYLALIIALYPFE